MVSVEFAGITISILLCYLFLYFNETWWKRIAGCFAIMITSVALGVVGDTIPMFVLMSVNILIALLQLVEDVGDLIGRIR